MNKVRAQTVPQAVEMLQHYLNFHDAAISKISFTKERELDAADGSLRMSPELAECNVVMGLLHNSYKGAKKDQMIVLEFKGVTAIEFSQRPDEDYSDILKVDAREKDGRIEVAFTSTFASANDRAYRSITLLCKEIVCKEL